MEKQERNHQAEAMELEHQRVAAQIVAQAPKEKKKPETHLNREKTRAIKRHQPWSLERQLSHLRNPVARFLAQFLRVMREVIYAPAPKEPALEKKPIVKGPKFPPEMHHGLSKARSLEESIQRYYAAQKKVMETQVEHSHQRTQAKRAAPSIDLSRSHHRHQIS
jgi:hypothetical protein